MRINHLVLVGLKISKNRFILLFLFVLIPIIGFGQIGCENEQIELLKLKLEPTFLSTSSIQIECDSGNMTLTIKVFESKNGSVKSVDFFNIPNNLYHDFKEAVLPLEIQSMEEKPNLYMTDGLRAEITFIDNHGNFNRFITIIPIQKNRNILLINNIILLAEKLQIKEAHRGYLSEVKDWYLKHCR